MRGIVPAQLGPVDLVGENWFSEKPLPVAIFWGFSPWKRPHMQAYFPGKRLAFVRGRRKAVDLNNFIQHFPNETVTFVGWGIKLPAYVLRYAKKHNISVQYVEDGFLRSFNPGALHIKPWSLTIDSRAPYYDTSRPTDLQSLLAASAQDTDALTRAEAGRAGIAIMRAARLTKYFPLNTGRETWQKPDTLGAKKIVLVIGQVEDDAAILRGYPRGRFEKPFSNLLVVERAAQDNPDAVIMYRPHPDTFHNGRQSRHEKKIARMCTVMEPTAPLQAVFPHVQHVYTGTSLVGLEAAIWDIPVTTLGYPFYAATPKIRNLHGEAFADLELPALFATIYFDYPRYIHPDSDEATTFFNLASYFIVEKFKYMILDGIPDSVLDLDTLRLHAAYLSPPAKLFLHLLELGQMVEANSEDILALAGDPLRYEDIPQFADLLIKARRFDTLALYLEKVVTQTTRDLETLKTRKFLMTRVMETLADIQKVLPGPIDVFLPDIADWIAPRQFAGYLIPDALLLAYARALSNNLQYDVLEHVIANIEHYNAHAEMPHGVSLMRDMAAILAEFPARSERNADRRANLLDRVGDLYCQRLIAEPGTSALVARATASMAKDHIHDVEAACEEILAQISSEDEQEQDEKKGFALESFRLQTPHIVALIDTLASNSLHNLADRLMAKLDENDPLVQVQRLRNFILRREFTAFHAFYEHLSDSMKARDAIQGLYMRAQMEEGEFLAALETVDKNLSLTTISRKQRELLHGLKEQLKVSLEASRILD